MLRRVQRGEHAPPALLAAKGVAAPPPLVGRLLAALRSTRWPAAPDRKGVASQEYLVLNRELKAGGAEPHEELKCACDAIMRWADPSWAYDHLAITKNFVASPHVDKEDKSYQYAMSLGDFCGGGELCGGGTGASPAATATRGLAASVELVGK